LEGTEGVG